MSHPDWRVCPRDEFLKDSWCDESGMWNELACDCFTMMRCRMMCPPGKEFDPREMCSCRDSEELKAELYPDWATSRDIDLAKNKMEENAELVRKLRVCPNNPNDSTTCNDGYYFNELACKCFAEIECKRACPPGTYELPTEICSCTDDEQQYQNLFPEWATAKDIELADFYSKLAYRRVLSDNWTLPTKA